MNKKIASLEVQRSRLHDYIIMKLEEHDYHAIADAAMDLRELEVKVTLEKELVMSNTSIIDPGYIEK